MEGEHDDEDDVQPILEVSVDAGDGDEVGWEKADEPYLQNCNSFQTPQSPDLS